MRLLLLPFKLLWEMFEFILKMTGRLVACILGLVILSAGLVLCITVVGAIVGIPLIIFGFMMAIRGFF